MTRRRRAARRRKAPPRTLRQWWTIARASGIGALAAAAMALLWVGHGYWPDALHLPFVAAAAVAALCGVSILWITAMDFARNGARGSRLAPIRAFDVALGLLLAGPALYALRALLRDGWLP
ncbi:MAG: hypothetical protein ACK4K7_14040 [Allosphingosinicella sp.]|uniref:hypothetical protein n=1 Tax=Allosphingosinicella sp. TaxID=2823234 RepID=UPI003933405A